MIRLLAFFQLFTASPAMQVDAPAFINTDWFIKQKQTSLDFKITLQNLETSKRQVEHFIKRHSYEVDLRVNGCLIFLTLPFSLFIGYWGTPALQDLGVLPLANNNQNTFILVALTMSAMCSAVFFIPVEYYFRFANYCSNQCSYEENRTFIKRFHTFCFYSQSPEKEDFLQNLRDHISASIRHLHSSFDLKTQELFFHEIMRVSQSIPILKTIVNTKKNNFQLSELTVKSEAQQEKAREYLFFIMMHIYFEQLEKSHNHIHSLKQTVVHKALETLPKNASKKNIVSFFKKIKRDHEDGCVICLEKFKLGDAIIEACDTCKAGLQHESCFQAFSQSVAQAEVLCPICQQHNAQSIAFTLRHEDAHICSVANDQP
jgi:hypothetical protein